MAAGADCHVAFIRAIMIGREGLHRAVLLDLFREAGAGNPVSYIATGNVSFEAPPRRVDVIAGRVEAGIEAIVGRPKPLFVRSLAHLAAMVDADPFTTAPFGDGVAREVVFFRGSVPSFDLPIVSPSGNMCAFSSSGRELFAVSRATGGVPEAPGGLIERLARESVTVRAWSTVTTVVRKLTT
jgi:uncharacterized protein (DUF1697 family)